VYTILGSVGLGAACRASSLDSESRTYTEWLCLLTVHHSVVLFHLLRAVPVRIRILFTPPRPIHR
jgi:hypothetical protein